MSRPTIYLDHTGARQIAARVENGVLVDLIVDVSAPRPGTIYRAVADRRLKGQGGLFLRTPDGAAFLRAGQKDIAPGQAVLVQVSGYAEPGKAIPVTTRLLFKSRYAIITPDAPGLNISRRIRDEALRDHLLELAHAQMEGAAMGLIMRSATAQATDDEICEDIAQMRKMAQDVLADTSIQIETLIEGDAPHTLAWRDWSMPADIVTEAGCLQTHGVLDVIDDATDPRIELQVGHMFVEPTRALVAVDVNTGADTSPAAGLKANLAAAKALPAALRLRGLGGQIVLDLAPMPKKDRRTFEQSLRAALRSDEIETTFVGWTPLGHAELQRKRARMPFTGLS